MWGVGEVTGPTPLQSVEVHDKRMITSNQGIFSFMLTLA